MKVLAVIGGIIIVLFAAVAIFGSKKIEIDRVKEG